jgi:riboflavin biosynthesis pyrimidine reductase
MAMRQIYPEHQPAEDVPADGQPGEELIDFLARSYAPPAAGRWVRANMVASVDGAISVDGRSGGLAGVADRLVFRVLRSLADVVLVGAGTARAERYGQVRPGDVWLRLRRDKPPTPPIAVVTRRLDLPLDSRLFGGQDRPGGDNAPRTIVLTTELVPKDQLKAAGEVADVIVAGERDVPAAAAISALTDRGYQHILTEGGPRLLGGLIAAGLLDELCLTVSPVLEGGHSAARVTAAPVEAPVVPPVQLRLEVLLEDDGYLFSRYIRASEDRLSRS